MVVHRLYMAMVTTEFGKAATDMEPDQTRFTVLNRSPIVRRVQALSAATSVNAIQVPIQAEALKAILTNMPSQAVSTSLAAGISRRNLTVKRASVTVTPVEAAILAANITTDARSKWMAE
jgi:hypothetical protein